MVQESFFSWCVSKKMEMSEFASPIWVQLHCPIYRK